MTTSTRAAFIAAAGIAVPALLAVGLAGGAQASTTSAGTAHMLGGVLVYEGSSADNKVEIRKVGSAVLVKDSAGINPTGTGCKRFESRSDTVSCTGALRFVARMNGGDDVFRTYWATYGLVDGGTGADSFYAGLANGVSRVEYRGGAGQNDVVTYRLANRAVVASLGTSGLGARDVTPVDGRLETSTTGADQDRIANDVEAVLGSDHNDTLLGNAGDNSLYGGPGRDRFLAGAGDDTINAADGSNDLWIDCGESLSDADFAVVDSDDTVRPGCETLSIG